MAILPMVSATAICTPPVSTLAFNTTFACYQETANSTSDCSGTCGCSATGTYSIPRTLCANWITPANLYDGTWSTSDAAVGSDFDCGFSASSNMYINYTKPTGANNNSKWQAKFYIDFSAVTANYSIPQACWDYDSTKLILRINDWYNAIGDSGDYLYCYSGSWTSVYTTQTIGHNFYEEAMIWNISNITVNTPSPTWNLNCADNCTFRNKVLYDGNINITGVGVLTFLNGLKFTGLAQRITIAKGSLPYLGCALKFKQIRRAI